mmetsp:Transcript_7912/g.7511  ORF Transcript_7912/g.7511 Transcript_7912/m.7511 type:complete len:230 (+) Transcript_7912:662-1351(+)
MLRIFPRNGKIACVRLSLPCLALPAAESPSTMNTSLSLASRLAQSANFPGNIVEVSNVFLRTISLAAFAAAAALCAAEAFDTMASKMCGPKSKSFVNSADKSESIAWRTSGLPSLLFVWPSNSGSVTLTEMMAVNPSLTNSPGRLGPSALSFPVFLAMALTVLVKLALRPSTCVPPSRVRMLLVKDRMLSLYISEDHLKAILTLTGEVPSVPDETPLTRSVHSSSVIIL